MKFGEQMVYRVTNIGHNCNARAKFAITGQVSNKSLSKLKIRSLLEHRGDFFSELFPAKTKHIT